jgi:hypothetical protein
MNRPTDTNFFADSCFGRSETSRKVSKKIVGVRSFGFLQKNISASDDLQCLIFIKWQTDKSQIMSIITCIDTVKGNEMLAIRGE